MIWINQFRPPVDMLPTFMPEDDMSTSKVVDVPVNTTSTLIVFIEASIATSLPKSAEWRLNALAARPKFENKEYRHAYALAAIEQGVAWQIRTNRERRGLTQEALARAIHSKQSAISRAEDPEYGRQSIETLTKIARAFDCALQVRLIPFSELALESKDLSPDALYVAPFDEEIIECQKIKDQNLPTSLQPVMRSLRHQTSSMPTD